MFLTYLTKKKRAEKKEEKTYQKKRKYSSAKDKRWVAERQQIHDDTTDSENCL
jgi:hypothetical protein